MLISTSLPLNVFPWPREHVQSFLLAVPMGKSFSSVTIHTSSIRRICSSSWPSSASPLVSMSGKRRKMVSAVMGTEVRVSVTVVDMMPGFRYNPVRRINLLRLVGTSRGLFLCAFGEGERGCSLGRGR